MLTKDWKTDNTRQKVVHSAKNAALEVDAIHRKLRMNQQEPLY